jgi:hypothetical protein
MLPVCQLKTITPNYLQKSFIMIRERPATFKKLWERGLQVFYGKRYLFRLPQRHPVPQYL